MAFTKKLLTCTIAVLALALLAGFLPVHGEEEIYDTVVRLHVIANSNSEEDQALKLVVRDRVLECAGPTLKDCKTHTEAVAAIGGIMAELEEEAERTVREAGYDYDVSVGITEEYYPTKSYESCAFPEGKYVSLQIKIGDSEGENWWCCLFPTLCLSAASDSDVRDNEEAFVSVGLTDDQYKIITETDTPKYRARFKILETFSRWFDK